MVYLLSCMTRVLMHNDIGLGKIHVDTVSYAGEAMDQVRDYIRLGFFEGGSRTSGSAPGVQLDVATTKAGSEIGSRVRDVVLALCHNVTLTTNTYAGALEATVTYQASSTGEIAILRRKESVGLRLSPRDPKRMKLQSVDTGKVAVRA